MRLPPAPLRRAVTIPALLIAAALGAGLLAAAVLLTGPVSLCLRGRWRAVRLGSFLVSYLVLEVVGLACAFGIWIGSGPASRRDVARYQELHYRLIEQLLARLYGVARRLFRLRVEVIPARHEPLPTPGGAPSGPVIVLARHAGPGDSFLLVYGLLAYARRRPLLVMKDTLALDPWIDMLLGRIPHSFIRPGPHGGRAVEQIHDLAAGMGGRDALVVFPEGGNFTPGRRRHAIRRLRRRGKPRRARQAERLGHVLPPRPGGALTAIEAAPQADVVVVAHTGLEHLDSVAAVWRGIPLDRPLRATWWRVPAGDVPTGPQARADWLYGQWSKVDGWIGRYTPSSRSKSKR